MSQSVSKSGQSEVESCLRSVVRQWDDEAGHWRGLDKASQAPRYAAVAEMLHRSNADRCVLDVGCGEALLLKWLPEHAVYVGIEPSTAAVQMAVSRTPSLRIHTTRAECFDARGERFDAVVFNEMLYYTRNPVGLVRKYAALLTPEGVVLCSIFQKPNGASLRSRLSMRTRVMHLLDPRRPISNVHCARMVRNFMRRQGWPILDDRLVNGAGSRAVWQVWLARPQGPLAPPGRL
jgi:2-polyprenyl-3-methyl-5-hydroxy-6-metoxy-1,4-benzoquinol methylase